LHASIRFTRCEYLDKTAWDGRPRIDNWLTYYLGVEPTSEQQALYINTIGARWLISAIARILKPGCKADCALILEGPQDKFKSTAFEKLAEPWFADELSTFGTKDAAMQLKGVWIMELAELSTLTRSDIAAAKAYLSRKADHYRPPYGRYVINKPRETIFGGTTNDQEYLNDTTGGRRFWPATSGNIDIDALQHDRDQLWAEALAAFRADAKWWITDDETKAAAKIEQAARAKTDVWDDRIAEILHEKLQRAAANQRVAFVTRAEILREIGIKDADQTHSHAFRVSDCLVRAGWERFKTSGKNNMPRGIWAYRKSIDINEG
jgi:predicted P-loop ATPase